MRFNVVQRASSELFGRYIRVVVRRPVPFIVGPVLVTFLLAFGLFRLSDAVLKDDLGLYTPNHAKARQEKAQLEKLFYINDSDPFYASRRYDIKRTGYVMVTSWMNDTDILDPPSLHAIIHLWNAIQSITVDSSSNFSHNQINYPLICVKLPLPVEINEAITALLPEAKGIHNLDEFCVSNPLVEFFKLALGDDQNMFPGMFTNTSTEHKISVDQLIESLSSLSIGIRALLGGLDLDESTGRVSGAKALMLPYALKHATPAEDALAEKWELRLSDFLLTFQSPIIRTSCWTYETLASESVRDRDQLRSLIIPCFIVICIYTVLMCCTSSWTHSRPLLAIAGVFSVGMAVVSGVGCLLLLGFKITSVVYAIPFIILAVGVDNVFIILSVWRATSPPSSSSAMGSADRMALTFSDAAVSITITSLTDLISFVVGCYTPFPSVQIFCVYAAVTIMFTYVYQFTFFAAIMSLNFTHEFRNKSRKNLRHFLGLGHIYSIDHHETKIPQKSNFEFHKISSKFVTHSEDPHNFEQNHLLSQFFYLHYSDFLLKPIVCWIVAIVTVFYLITAGYGCAHLKLGLEPIQLLSEDSFGKRALQTAEKYFAYHGNYLHVWMHNLSALDLGHRRLWLVLDREIALYEHTEFTGSGDSWLRAFFHWQNHDHLLTTEANFVPRLNRFLSLSQFRRYRRDIVFDGDQKRLDASRVPIFLRNVGFQNQSRAMELFRRLAETSELPTSVYADFFMFAEQYNSLILGTLSSIAIAGLAVILVSLIFIPEPITALCVSFSILSINMGTLGFMTFLSIRLDFVSMVTIIMSIGFCVDFGAHLAYNYSLGEGISSEQKMRNALYAVGTPILQSASSTILGVSFLVWTDSYIFRSFFKTIILVITLGVIHGLVILPVLLSYIDIIKQKLGCADKDYKRTKISIHHLTVNDISPPLQNNSKLFDQIDWSNQFNAQRSEECGVSNRSSESSMEETMDNNSCSPNLKENRIDVMTWDSYSKISTVSWSDNQNALPKIQENSESFRIHRF